ncbi:transcription factor RF2b-like [Quercus lobata]|uniref:BZIP domain-containing protein n=1 Tax=Quercus lobata TaxID=97700 RepID=A0A7N2QXK2_QUELO|nr:transcription factor RF2b-like [Quercus lobata]
MSTQMQDPPPSNPNSHNNHHQLNSNNASHSHPPQPPKKSQPLPAITNTTTSFMKGGGHHRRAHSEVSFRLSDDMMMDLSPSDAFNGGGGSGGGGGGGGGGSSTASLDEIGSEDDLFSTYIDVDKLGGADQSGVEGNGNGNGEKSGGDGGGGGGRGRHRHSSSVDGSSTTTSSTGVFGEIMDAKKAMPPDKLAELWSIDPKRAKRILANRQSAARSKERKARYIQELERKVQTLQTEATTLSAQLTLFQRDTTGLSTENTELKLRLQAMEQQAQLRDALNEALKKEVERLKMATGEMMSPSESFSMGMHQMQFAPSTFFPHLQQQGPAGHQNMQLPFSHSQSSMSTHQMHQSNSHALSEMMQNDHLRRLQGLDISSQGSSLVKSEGPTLSASESSSTF